MNYAILLHKSGDMYQVCFLEESGVDVHILTEQEFNDVGCIRISWDKPLCDHKVSSEELIVILGIIAFDETADYEITGNSDIDVQCDVCLKNYIRSKLESVRLNVNKNEYLLYGNELVTLTFTGGGSMKATTIDEIYNVLAGVTLYNVFNKSILFEHSPMEYALMNGEISDELAEGLLNYIDTLTFKYVAKDTQQVNMVGSVCTHTFEDIRGKQNKTICKELKEHVRKDFDRVNSNGIKELASPNIMYADLHEQGGIYAVAGQSVPVEVVEKVQKAKGF